MKKAILVAITLILSVGGCQQSEGYQSYESCVYNETTYDVNQRGMNRSEARTRAIESCDARRSRSSDYGDYR
jgi:hypothetical protein